MISPRACLQQNKKVFSDFCVTQRYFSVQNSPPKCPGWGQVVTFLLSPSPLSTVLDKIQAWSGCQFLKPGDEECFLLCPETEGYTRCHGSTPTSSCWKHTPAPSASSACQFKLRAFRRILHMFSERFLPCKRLQMRIWKVTRSGSEDAEFILVLCGINLFCFVFVFWKAVRISQKVF